MAAPFTKTLRRPNYSAFTDTPHHPWWFFNIDEGGLERPHWTRLLNAKETHVPQIHPQLLLIADNPHATQQARELNESGQPTWIVEYMDELAEKEEFARLLAKPGTIEVPVPPNADFITQCWRVITDEGDNRFALLDASGFEAMRVG